MSPAYRTPSEAIRRRRAARSGAILLTGATGFLGSHLAIGLLRRGFRVIMMGRTARGMNAGQRVERLLDWLDAGALDKSRYTVVAGDLDRTGLGLDPRVHRRLQREVVEIVHCAAATNFGERYRDQVEAVNVEGLNRLLDFAAGGHCDFFHHMSTAYVAGIERGPCVEAIQAQNRFHNVYESSKHQGERLVEDRCADAGIRCNIFRPTIVYGDSRTGVTLRFNALYYPIKTAVLMKELFVKDLEGSRNTRAKQMGIEPLRGGLLRLPLRVETSADGEINIIPVDFFTRFTLDLVERVLEGGIFHVAAPKGQKIEAIVDHAKRYFGFRGVRCVTSDTFEHSPKSALERLFDKAIGMYKPYMSDPRRFPCQNGRRALGRRFPPCPDFDYGMFRRCMDFALAVQWGKNMLQPRGVGPGGSRSTRDGTAPA